MPSESINPAFLTATQRLAELMTEAYRRAQYVEACMFIDMIAGRTPRKAADYLLEAGIDVEAERGRLR